jgi:hypothetical protein
MLFLYRFSRRLPIDILHIPVLYVMSRSTTADTWISHRARYLLVPTGRFETSMAWDLFIRDLFTALVAKDTPKNCHFLMRYLLKRLLSIDILYFRSSCHAILICYVQWQRRPNELPHIKKATFCILLRER